MALFSPQGGDTVLRLQLADHEIDTVGADEGADGFIVDLRSLGTNTDPLSAAIQRGRREAATLPILFLVDPAQINSPVVTRLCAVDTVVPATRTMRVLLRALHRVVADSDRAAEVSVRLRAMTALGTGHVGQTPVPNRDRALILAEPGPATLPLWHELSTLMNVEAAITRSQTLQALEAGEADAIIMPAAKNRRPQASLVRLLRRHADLHNLPIAIVERSVTHRHTQFWTDAGADLVVPRQNVAALAAFCQRSARARSASQALDAMLSQTVLSDHGEQSNLAACRYFDTVLALRLKDQDRPHTLAALRLDPTSGDHPQAALSEASVYVAMATRAIDLVARPSPDLMLISLPGTDHGVGAVTMRTLEQMIQDLKFGSESAACTFRARTAHTVVTPGMSVDTVLSKLLRTLPPEPAATLHIA